MERTMDNKVIKNLIGRHVEKNGGFSRLACLSLLTVEQLMDFYFEKQGLNTDELLRLGETLVNEHNAGEF